MDIDKINALYYQSKNKLLKENAPVASAPQEYVVHYKTQQGTDAKNTVSLNQLSDRIKYFLQKGLTITGVSLVQQSENNEDTNQLSRSENEAIYDLQQQKSGYSKFALDYSEGATFGNNLLAVYGIGKRGRMWLTDFQNDAGEPLAREKIENILKKVGLSKLIDRIPSDYGSSEGFKGTHA